MEEEGFIASNYCLRGWHLDNVRALDLGVR